MSHLVNVYVHHQFYIHTMPSYRSELGSTDSGIHRGAWSHPLKDFKEHLHFHLVGTFKVSYH